MPLPTIVTPTFEIELISNGKKLELRPFLVKEEKLLLMALESAEKKNIIEAIKTIIKLCIKTPNINVDELASFDIEYIFLKIRENSLGGTITVSLTCPETKKKFEADLNLSDIKIDKPVQNNIIKISDNVGLTMKYPTFQSMQLLYDQKITIDSVFNVIIFCIENIYDNENVYNCKDYTTKELSDFLDSLPQNCFNEINNYFTSLPKLYFDVLVESPYTNKMVKVRLDNFLDFFV